MSRLQAAGTTSRRPARIRRAMEALHNYDVVAETKAWRGISGHTEWRVRERSTNRIVFRSWYHTQACTERDRLTAHAVIDAMDGK